MKLWKIIIGIVGSLFAGGIGSFFTSPSIPTWYASLARPDLAPPNWIFAPVWTTLFILMGIAVGLVWSVGTEKKEVKMALGLFGLQLVLNSLWSIIFFGLQSPGWAFVEILVLWTAIAITIASFYKIYRPAAWLLLPYIAWVSFAAYLNYSIWMLN
jgi:tryptophan-rich sensory protein